MSYSYSASSPSHRTSQLTALAVSAAALNIERVNGKIKAAIKRFLFIAALVVSMTALAWGTEQNEPASGFDAQQRHEFEEIIRQYILDHPEVIGEALQKLQAQEQQAEEQRSREATG